MTIVRTPDGINVDFGDRSPDEIRRLLLQRYPNLARQSAGVAGVPGGLGAPRSGVDLAPADLPGARTGGFLDPSRPRPGDIRGGFSGSPGVDLPRTTEDLAAQMRPAETRQGEPQSQQPGLISRVGSAIVSSLPEMAGGLAGGIAGGVFGGPVGAVAGGAAGAGAVDAWMGARDTYAEELQKLKEKGKEPTAEEYDHAWDKSVVRGAQEGLFGAASWGAFGLSPFKGFVKNMLFQSLGVQPGIATLDQVLNNHEEGRDLTDGAAQAAFNAMLGTALPMTAFHGVGRAMESRSARKAVANLFRKAEEPGGTRGQLRLAPPPEQKLLPPPAREAGPPADMPTRPTDVVRGPVTPDRPLGGPPDLSSPWPKREPPPATPVKPETAPAPVAATPAPEPTPPPPAKPPAVTPAGDSFTIKGKTITPIATHKAPDFIRAVDISSLLTSPLAKKLIPFIHKQIVKHIEDIPLHIVKNEDLYAIGGSRTARGAYLPKLNRIVISEKTYGNPRSLAGNLLHEGLHAVTEKALTTNPAIRKVLTLINDQVKGDLIIKRKMNADWRYITSDIHELTAYAFTHPDVQNYLSKIQIAPDVMKTLGMPKGKRSAWDAIITAVRKIIGLPDNGHSVLEALMRPVQMAMENEPVTGVRPETDIRVMLEGADPNAPASRQMLGLRQFVTPAMAAARAAIMRANRLGRATFSPSSLSKTSPYYGSQTFTAETFRSQLGELGRFTAKDVEKMEKFHPVFNRIHKGWGNDPSPPGSQEDTQLDWARRMQGVRQTPLKNKELEAAAQVVKQTYAGVRNRFSQRPAWQHLSWIDDYLTGNWKPGPALDKFRSEWSGKLGTGRYLKEKKYLTIDDAIDAKLEPKYDNMLDMVAQYHESMNRHNAKWATYDILKDAEYIKFFNKHKPPEGWVALENGGPVKERNFIDAPSGPMRAYMQEDQARIWNNMVSPSVEHYSEKWGNFLTFVKHGQNMFSKSILAWPAFHAMTVSLSAMSDQFASGLDDTIGAVLKGERAQWKMGASKMVSAIGAPLYDYWAGRKLNNQFLGINNYGPEYEKIAKLAARANFKTRGANVEWRSTGAGNFWQAWQRGALKKQMKAYGEEYRQALSSNALKALPITGEIMGRLVDTMFAPLWDHYIPSLKMGAFYYNMKSFIDRNPMASNEELDRAARGFADSMDNRFGQLQNDNVFWHNITRQGLQLSLLSASWQTAYLREAVGALYDVGRFARTLDPKHLSTRVSYTVSAALMTAMAGGVANMMLTGQPPQSLKDLFWPRTGGKNADGTDERIMLPGHEKDINELLDVAGKGFAPSAVARVVSGKLNPFLLQAYQVYMGQDYRGLPLNPTNDVTSLIGRLFENVLSQGLPIPVQQQMAGPTKGSNLGTAANLLGMRKAPIGVVEPGLTEKIDASQRLQQARRKFFSDRRQQQSSQDPHLFDSRLQRDRDDIQEIMKQLQKANQKMSAQKKEEGSYQGMVGPQ